MKGASVTEQGFSLLELAIVIAVIALIAAGVVLGRSQIEISQLQSIVSDVDRYRRAALTYRDRYQQLPGDHTGATSLTSADGGCPNPSASNAKTTATCNGNGDGYIGDVTGNPLGAFTTYSEPLLVWQHLTNSGILSGAYTGRRSTAAGQITPDVNMPASRFKDGLFMLRHFPTNTVTTGYFKADYRHVFFFGTPGSSAAYPLNGAVLTTDQAKSIDQKIDDGRPGLGKVLTTPASVRACPTTSVESTAIYDSSVSGAACALIFITGF